MGGQGAATVVIAQPDPNGRELLARIVEAAGQDAVRIDSAPPPVLVDTTVESSALLLVVDVTTLGFADLDAVVSAFTTRRYPAQVIALADGPASAAWASSAGAAAVLERPFHRRDFVAAVAGLLGVDVPAAPPYEPPPASTAGIEADDAPAVEPELAGDEPEPAVAPTDDRPSVAEGEPAVEEAAVDEVGEEPVTAVAVSEEDGSGTAVSEEPEPESEVEPTDDDAAADPVEADDDEAGFGIEFDPELIGARGIEPQPVDDGARPTDHEAAAPAAVDGPEPASSAVDEEDGSDEGDEEEPSRTADPSPALDHSFTDILRLGRQL